MDGKTFQNYFSLIGHNSTVHGCFYAIFLILPLGQIDISVALSAVDVIHVTSSASP